MQSTNKNRHWLAWTITATLWAGATSLQAALVTFSFNGAAGNEASFAADAQPVGAIVSSMIRGTGLIANAGSETFNSRNWTTDTSRDLTDYYSFTITPEVGYELMLTRLELDERRSGTGIRQWAIYSILDEYVGALASFAVPDNTLARTAQGVELGLSFAALTSPVEFRIYGFEAESAAGTWWIDNVKLSGYVRPLANSVPDTGSSLALLSLALGGIVWGTRRLVR